MRALVVLLLVGCHPVGEGKTAVQLEQEAEAKRANAAQAEAYANVLETTEPVPSSAERERSPSPPLLENPRGRYVYETGSAAQLERAARKIREEAERECARVPPSTRRSCPIGDVARVADIPRGVQIYTRTPAETEAWRSEVQCAVAQARVDVPHDVNRCPFLVGGAQSRVVDTPAGPYMEITAPDDARAAEVKRRAQALVPR